MSNLMSKNEIVKILEDWNFWTKDLNTGVPRELYLDELDKIMPSEQIKVITGARRSGKSYLMRQMAKRLMDEKGVNKSNILIVNFEDPRFSGLSTGLLQHIFDVYLEHQMPQGKIYVFLDEVQEIPQWEKWVRTVQELGKANIVVSGSNAKLLSGELATVLTGRHLDTTVLPLSFRELLSFKDLKKRYKIRKTEEIKILIKFYLSNISSPVTFSSSGKFLRMSAQSVERFSSYLEASYLLFFLKRFSFKVKEQEKSPRKVYAVDTGLANTVGFQFSGNLGKLAENLVFLELKRKTYFDQFLEIYYWKSLAQEEVDFVVKKGAKIKELIQVCWDLQNVNTKKRETKALLKAMNEFKLKKGLIITEDYEGEEDYEEKKIQYVTLRKWLLGSKALY